MKNILSQFKIALALVFLSQFATAQEAENPYAIFGSTQKVLTEPTGVIEEVLHIGSESDEMSYKNQMARREALLRSIRASRAEKYRFGFNGMERDDDFTMGSYDFGARLYNPAIGRWNARDPLESKYPGISTYAFVANSPMMFVDPDGKKIEYVGDDASINTIKTWINFIKSTSTLGNDIISHLEKSDKLHTIYILPIENIKSATAVYSGFENYARSNPNDPKVIEGRSGKGHAIMSGVTKRLINEGLVTDQDILNYTGIDNYSYYMDMAGSGIGRPLVINHTSRKEMLTGISDKNNSNRIGTGSDMFLSIKAIDNVDNGGERRGIVSLMHELIHQMVADMGLGGEIPYDGSEAYEEGSTDDVNSVIYTQILISLLFEKSPEERKTLLNKVKKSFPKTFERGGGNYGSTNQSRAKAKEWIEKINTTTEK